MGKAQPGRMDDFHNEQKHKPPIRLEHMTIYLKLIEGEGERVGKKHIATYCIFYGFSWYENIAILAFGHRDHINQESWLPRLTCGFSISLIFKVLLPGEEEISFVGEDTGAQRS